MKHEKKTVKVIADNLLNRVKGSELEVDKWYAYSSTRLPLLFQFTGRYGDQVAYGINASGEWKDSLGVVKDSTYIELSSKQVGEMLLAVAKEKGFEPGVQFYGVQGAEAEELKTIGKIRYHKDAVVGLYFENSYLYYMGKWAEPYTDDWATPRYVVGREGTVVLTTGEHTGDDFTGVVVLSGGWDYKIGELANNWDKGSFKPCKISITSENL